MLFGLFIRNNNILNYSFSNLDRDNIFSLERVSIHHPALTKFWSYRFALLWKSNFSYFNRRYSLVISIAQHVNTYHYTSQNIPSQNLPFLKIRIKNRNEYCIDILINLLRINNIIIQFFGYSGIFHKHGNDNIGIQGEHM